MLKNRIHWIIAGFITLFIATFLFYGVKLFLLHWFMAHFEEPPVYVSTIKAEQKTWHPHLSAIGTLKASNGVDVNSQVSGQILSIDFQSGEHVKQGDLLVQLNDAVDQQALLRDAAKLRLDQVDYERKELLVKENAVSRSAVDAAKASFLQSQAAVASDNVMIQQKKISAPFAGKIGIRKVNVGQYITTGTAIVTLQALNPLYVDFSLPEQDLPLVHKTQVVKITTDAYPHQIFEGAISAINSTVDINTRSIAVRATVPNPDEKLFPGLYASVKVILPDEKNVITVPQSAITYSLYGDSVYVVEDKGKDKKNKPLLVAVQKYVKVGDRRANIVAVKEGLSIGDEVVTSGQLKLHPNARVLVNNTVELR